MRTTGNTLDLVELIYGLDEMGCINNGETSLKELSAALYEFFGICVFGCIFGGCVDGEQWRHLGSGKELLHLPYERVFA